MRIAYIHPRWPGSEGTGATHTATQIVRGLAARGHEVTAHCQEPPPENFDPVPGLSVKSLDLSGWPYHTASQLNRELENRIDEFESFDVVNCYLPTGLPGMETIGERTDTAVGVTLNAYGAICPKNDLLYLDREQCTHRSIARCGACIATTSPGHEEFSAPYRMASRLGNLRQIRKGARKVDSIDFFRAPSRHVRLNHEEFGFPSDPIHVIPHPIDERFLVEHESDFAPPYRLLYVGFLEKHKGVDKLVPILDGVKAQLNEPVTLTVVGTGGRESRMKRQAKVMDLTEHVDFRGFVPNERLPAVYARHDVFVYPGVWDEPLARVYLEALATGTPMVTSDYGSVSDIVDDGGIVSGGTVESLANAIAESIRNRRLGKLSAGARRKTADYVPETVIPSIESMYDSAVV